MYGNLSAIILAAVNSTRMGECKCLLKMPDGMSFFEHIWRRFVAFGVRKVIVVTQAQYIGTLEEICHNSEIKPDFVKNEFPERERFYSLQLGIKSLGECDFAFITNADSPFVDLETLLALYRNKDQADYAVPVFESKGGHPILVNAKVLGGLSQEPENSMLNEALKKYTRCNVKVSNPLLLADINSPGEYQNYFG